MLKLPWSEFALLDQLGFSSHEKKVLLILCVLGVADAATLCREGEIPSSKIYRITEKLHGLGLLERTHARPALYAAPGPEELLERLTALKRREAERFALEAESLRAKLLALPQQLGTRSSRVDLALGSESHVKRHLTRLGAANTEVLSYLEQADLDAIVHCAQDGFNLWRHVQPLLGSSKTSHRMIFGIAPNHMNVLLKFLRDFAPWLQQLTGLRYAGIMGHPFHVIDQKQVILAVDHPFVSGGRVASLLIDDAELASRLAEGFEGLWSKALRDLREVRAVPMAFRG